MHAHPSSDLIELPKFNQLVREHCSSIEMLKARMRTYFKKTREELLHKMDVQIERQLLQADRIHTPETIRHIRDKNYRDLDSDLLGRLIHRELNEGLTIREQLEVLRNKISERISEKNSSMDTLLESVPFNALILGDLIQAK